MKSLGLKCALVLSCGLLAATANAAPRENAGKAFADRDHVVYHSVRGGLVQKAGSNLVNHGGPVITQAHVVLIFWGPTFADTTNADHTYATTLQSFRNQYGTNSHYAIITQYSGSNGTVQASNLAGGTADSFDTTTPPTNVTDAIVQSEVNKYLQTHTLDVNAIYEVVIPRASYSSSGSSTSCGGPSLSYCAYHGWIGSGTGATKYSIEPYPSCSGCALSGWSDAQNQEHFITHETRESVTDPLGSTWFDRRGNEADDKCAWTPTPFLDGGFGYQYEWSNAASACVQ